MGRRALGDREGGRAFVEESDGNIDLAMSLRNVGAGIAVLHGWHPDSGLLRGEDDYPALDRFRRQGRDLYVPPGGSSFWQGALRDQNDDTYRTIHEAVASRTIVTIHLLYGDHEGGQRAVSRFSLAPSEEGTEWICSVIRHWNVDRHDPR